MSDEDLSVVEQHAVDGLDGSVGSLSGLVVDETVTSGSSSIVDGDLAGEDVSEGGEGVVESLKEERGSRVSEEERENDRAHVEDTHLVVNSLVEVLDEDVSLSSLPESRVSLGPHDSAGSSLDEGVVEGVKSSLSCRIEDEDEKGVSFSISVQLERTRKGERRG